MVEEEAEEGVEESETLWEVSDKYCVEVAAILYQTLQKEGMTDMAVSRGLHRALRALRDKGAGEDNRGRDAMLVCSETATPAKAMDYYWVPYVHFGA